MARIDTDYIDSVVNDILTDLSINKPSIDVVRIASHYNIKITSQTFDDDSSGFLLVKDGKAIIAINSETPINRQRFTIGHELGHYFLHVNNGDDLFLDKTLYHRNDKSSYGTIAKEIEANHFSASLLMPDKMIQQVIDEEQLDLSDDLDLLLLSKKFAVSEKAMGYRLGNLGLCF